MGALKRRRVSSREPSSTMKKDSAGRPSVTRSCPASNTRTCDIYIYIYIYRERERERETFDTTPPVLPQTPALVY